MEAMQEVSIRPESPEMILVDDEEDANDDDDVVEVMLVNPNTRNATSDPLAKTEAEEEVVQIFVPSDDEDEHFPANTKSIRSNVSKIKLTTASTCVSKRKLSTDYDFRRLLITLVRQQRVLYDPQHIDFLKQNAKDAAWTYIGKHLHTDTTTCRSLWADLRCEYQRYVRRLHKFISQQISSKQNGNAAPSRRPQMAYEKDLLFLYQFVSRRGRVKNSDMPTRCSNVADSCAAVATANASLARAAQAVDDGEDDDVIIDIEEPVFIDLESEEHRVLPYKFTLQSRGLIAAVSAYPELYDVNNSNYSNFKRRGIIWSAIANELKDKATKLMKFWLQIQMRYEWELRIGYAPKHNGESYKPSMLQEMLEFLEPHIKNNHGTLFKQSHYLMLDWYDPIEHFKTVHNLVNALKFNMDAVKLTELSIAIKKKSPNYDQVWQKVATFVNCAPAQCEITWLVLRAFYQELVEMRKVGYQLQDKWYFESMVGDIYKELSNSQKHRRDNVSKKHEQYVHLHRLLQSTPTVDTESKKDNNVNGNFSGIDVTACVAQASIDAVINSTKSLRKVRPKGALVTALTQPPPTIMPPIITAAQRLQSPLISNTTVSATGTVSSVITSVADMNDTMRMPRITAAISLAPLLGRGGTTNANHQSINASAAALAMLANSQINNATRQNPQTSSLLNSTPMHLPPQRFSYVPPNSTMPRPTLPASTTLQPTLAPPTSSSINRPVRPSVTVSIRPGPHFDANAMLPRVIRPVLISTSRQTINTATSAAAAVNNLLSPQTSAITTTANIPTTCGLSSQVCNASVYLRNLLKAPPATMQPTALLHAAQHLPSATKITPADATKSQDTSSSNTFKPIILSNNYGSTLNAPKADASSSRISGGVIITPNLGNVTITERTPTTATSIAPAPMVMVHCSTTNSQANYSMLNAANKPNKSLPATVATLTPIPAATLTPITVATLTPIGPAPFTSSATLTPLTATLTPVPALNANHDPMKITHASALLNPNEIMIELIASPKGNNLVIHGPPLPVKYSLSMSKTTQLIREIMAIPVLHNKTLKRTKKTNDYWQYIAKKFNLPVHVCKASWNFLADNMSHFPQIAPLSELMRPFKSALKVWEKSNILFRKFNASALRKGWILYRKHLPNLMIYVSKFDVLYNDVRRVENRMKRKRDPDQKTSEIWTSASVLYPEIENIPEIWSLFKHAFIYYMNDLERGIENPWPQNWWRVLEQLKFLINVRYSPLEAFYYIVHQKYEEEVARCKLYDALMTNNQVTATVTATTTTTTSIASSGSLTSTVNPYQNFSSAAIRQETLAAIEISNQPSTSAETSLVPLLQRQMNCNIDCYELIRAIRRHPHIYETSSSLDKRNAWLAVSKEMKASVNDCRLGLQRALRGYRILKTRDPANRCRLNIRYYKHFADIYRITKQRGKINVKSPQELNQSTNEPTELIFPERFVPEINMHTSKSALVLKNWAYAISSLTASTHYELPAKLRKIFSKYAAIAAGGPIEPLDPTTIPMPILVPAPSIRGTTTATTSTTITTTTQVDAPICSRNANNNNQNWINSP